MSLNRGNVLINLSRKLRYSTSATNPNGDISPVLTNRNPRNLERLRIGYKPDGWHLERPGRRYWHKLQLNVTTRSVSATVRHFQNGDVIKASTKEWGLERHLYSLTDASAYVNLARVLAERCLQSGINEVYCDVEPTRPDGKVATFLKVLAENGVTLEEPPQFKAIRPWDQERPEKSWEVTE